MMGALYYLLHLPRAVYLIAAVIYMGGIYVLSSLKLPLKDTSHPQIWSFFSNLFHFPLYTGLGMVLILGLRSRKDRTGTLLDFSSILLALFVLGGYAAFDEYHQSWTGRTPSLSDFFIDLCGGILSGLVLKFLLEKSFRPGLFLLGMFALILLACCLAYTGLGPGTVP